MTDHPPLHCWDVLTLAARRAGAERVDGQEVRSGVVRVLAFHSPVTSRHTTRHVVIGEGFGFEITHEVKHLLYMFFGGNLAIAIWKCS